MPSSRIEVRSGADNHIALTTLPDAVCTLRDPARPGADAELKLSSDSQGGLSFTFRPAPGSATALTLACRDQAGVTTTSQVELQARDDIAPLLRPIPIGPRRLPLSDPDARTPEEIAAAGYPARPEPSREPQLYQLWKELVTRAPTRIQPHLRPSAQGLMNGPPSKPNVAWAGYLAVEPFRGYSPPPYHLPLYSPYEVVSGTWDIPVVSGTDPSGRYHMSVWVGIGNGDNPADGFVSYGALWQAGSTTNLVPLVNPITLQTSQMQTDELWIELIPGSSTSASVGLPADPGDHIVTTIWLSPSSGTCGWSNRAVTFDTNTQQLGFLIWNRTASQYAEGCLRVTDPILTNGIVSPVGITGGSAEWIVERPTIDGLASASHKPLLPDFHTLTMQSNWAIDAQNTSSFYSAIATYQYLVAEKESPPGSPDVWGPPLIQVSEASAQDIDFTWVASQ